MEQAKNLKEKLEEEKGGGLIFLNNGHALALDLTGTGTGGVTYQNGFYAIQAINFHFGSEHKFKGKRYPLEVHFVHKHLGSEKVIENRRGLWIP
jgi:carbonic anhydrase